MKKSIKIATALTICGVVLVGAIYYTNNIYIPSVKKNQAKKADSSVQTEQTSDYHYTISTNVPVSSGSSAAGSSLGSNVQVTKNSNGDETINRTWDAKKGDLDTSTSSPDSKTSANIGSGGAKITSSDGTYKGETPAKSSSSTTTKSTTPSTSKSSGSTKTGSSTKTAGSTPKNGDTRTVDGQKQVYIDGFGWVMDASGGESPTIGNADDDLGKQVGEMG